MNSLKARKAAANFKKQRAKLGRSKGIKPIRSARYRKFIREQQCCIPNCVCRGASPFMRAVECCHTGPHGMGQKSSDMDCIPMCRWMHQEAPNAYHKGVRGFFERVGVNLPETILKLQAEFRAQRAAA